MYLHIGQNTAIPFRSIIGIFDMENTTQSRITRAFLKNAERRRKVINICEELPKSFVLCTERREEKVYISQLSSATLFKRTESGRPEE